MSKSTEIEPDRPENATARTPDGQKRGLSPEAERALTEAAARRAQAHPAAEPREAGGRGGLDPTRYGDWEIGGIAADF
jgi:hypothetical protein